MNIDLDLKKAGSFAYDFVIGDDWHVAATVAAGLILVGLLSLAGLNAWWLLPLCVFGALGWSLHKATSKS